MRVLRPGPSSRAMPEVVSSILKNSSRWVIRPSLGRKFVTGSPALLDGESVLGQPGTLYILPHPRRKHAPAGPLEAPVFLRLTLRLDFAAPPLSRNAQTAVAGLGCGVAGFGARQGIWEKGRTPLLSCVAAGNSTANIDRTTMANNATALK